MNEPDQSNDRPDPAAEKQVEETPRDAEPTDAGTERVEETRTEQTVTETPVGNGNSSE